MTNFPWKRALRRKTVWFSLLIMLFFVLIAVLAPWIAPHDPYRGSMTAATKSLPPMWVDNPIKPGNVEFPLGTDIYGRDVLSRLIYGARTAIFLAITAVTLAALIGSLVGLISGYMGGKIDSGFMLASDMVQSLPGIMIIVIVVLIFRSLFSPSWLHGMITLVIGFVAVGWVGLARLVRVNVLVLKSQAFIEAARAMGASPWEIITQHLFPNVLHVITVWVINNIPAVILVEAILGYIGIGITSAMDGGEFSVVSWGGMFFAGRSAMSRNPLMLIIPSLSILLISMSFILLADFLNEISRQGQQS